jgi:hypothetical protein
MNAVEIEEAISNLAEQPFNPAEFPFAFLEAFGNKAATISRLKSSTANKSDIENGVLQYNNIHMAVSTAGEVSETLKKLRESPATSRQKAKFILATDGEDFQAEDLGSGETVACQFKDFPNHFGFFLPLAGISTVKQITENSFDIRATSRLNRLYVELLKDNPEWGTGERRHDMNHFMARLIFCFFAEDTSIFNAKDLFTKTIDQMSAKDSSNTHEVIAEIFRAMNTKIEDRTTQKTARWADPFPYVNGGLFSGSTDTPKFSKIARSYLIHVGNLDWTKINPDIFGSMIQAVADDEERGALGMHYTSVPNILKVLNPLFLDDLREKLAEAGDNARMLLNLRKRMARIRVFDPACGSGNFLVIAYKQMREIEFEINKRRGEDDNKTEIPLTNFRGIELRDFPAEVARLALIIAEYQCDVLYRGQKEALAEFLPLDAQNWITCGNALRLDWLSVCPPTGKGVKLHGDDLFNTPLDQAQIDFENEGGETYICGNPPYKGSKKREKKLTDELGLVLAPLQDKWKDNDYVAGWFVKSAQYIAQVPSTKSALVTTNSISQGLQVDLLWPLIFRYGIEIGWAHTSFKWSNLATNKATVTVVVIGLQQTSQSVKTLYDEEMKKSCQKISPYLVDSKIVSIKQASDPLSNQPVMKLGNMPYGKGLLLDGWERNRILEQNKSAARLIRRFAGGEEFLHAIDRYCLWIDDEDIHTANSVPLIKERIDSVREQRSKSTDASGKKLAARAHQFRERYFSKNQTVVLARTSSETREYLPAGLADPSWVFSSETFVLYDAPLWVIALLSSKIHLIWIATVCGKLETRIRYSNTLGWNTFPVPLLTEKNIVDLTRCAEDILLARETHFPKTIAELYEVKDGESKMPENLRHAHERNDEVLERIYIGRRFKNDTERLEKLFDLYTKMTTEQKRPNPKRARAS